MQLVEVELVLIALYSLEFSSLVQQFKEKVSLPTKSQKTNLKGESKSFPFVKLNLLVSYTFIKACIEGKSPLSGNASNLEKCDEWPQLHSS